MSRARAQHLVLINWRGIFFERFQLDRRVTALEGANGAGKTTVMIGAYVVLLPDMSLLRFTNVGEQGAIGGDRGLYGRLGEPHRPSYAVLDLRQPDGARVLAGVHLERRSEPGVELRPFLIIDIEPDASLQRLLLLPCGETEEVPDLSELQRLAARAGGRLQVFDSAKDYFAALFDRGITPLRLAGDEERGKFNEMLRASMIGGISRTLSGGLREFLLKEDTGLADTLRQMRSVLDACRRTRREVDESSRLEVEIRGVFEAGQRMFAAATQAARERADEQTARLRAAEEARDRAAELRDRLAQERDALALRHQAARLALDQAQAALVEAELLLQRTRAAHASYQEILRLREEAARQRAEVAARAQAQARAAEALQVMRRARDQARRGYERAARGVADARSGLDDLQRKAAEFRQARHLLQVAVAALPDLDLPAPEDPAGPRDERTAPSGAGQRRERLDRARHRAGERLGELDRALVAAGRELASAEAQRREFEEVCEALAAVLPPGVAAPPPDQAFEAAGRCLAALRAEEALAAEAAVLPAQVAAAEEQARAQEQARCLADDLAQPGQRLSGVADVQAALAASSARLEADRDREAQERAAQEQARLRAQEAAQRVKELEHKRERYLQIRYHADTLAERFTHPLADSAAVDALWRDLQAQQGQVAQALTADAAEHERLAVLLHDLEHSGGHFDPALLRARDHLGGQLLAGFYEEIPVEEAAVTQALLGPLRDAVLVDDVEEAVRALGQLPPRQLPDTLLLLDGASAAAANPGGRPPGAALEGGAVVRVAEAAGVRVTRVPEQPSIGRRARRQRIAALQQRSVALEQVLAGHRARRRHLDDGLEALRALAREAAVLDRGDPLASLEAEKARQRQADEDRRNSAANAAEARLRCQAERPRQEALQRLLSLAYLLEAPEQAAAARRLTERLQAARAAAERLQMLAAPRDRLERGLPVLRVAPRSAAELTELARREQQLAGDRDRLAPGVMALRDLALRPEALDFGFAEDELARQQALTPALEANLRRAEQALREHEAQVDSAEQDERAAQARSAQAENALHALGESLRRREDELQAAGVAHYDQAALQRAVEQQRQVAGREAAAQREERELGDRGIVIRTNLDAAERAALLQRAEVEAQERSARPAQERWARLQAQAQERGVLREALGAVERVGYAGRGSINLASEASKEARLLSERLEGARDGKELAALARRESDTSAEQSSGEAYLELWLQVRDWLRRRLPATVAEVDDPLEALRRLRDHLAALRDRLAQQERDLRGRSTSVAEHIEVHIRRVHAQVQKLNKDLRAVRFGAIREVRIRPERVERMEQVLKALREDDAQEALFGARLSVEDALEELLRRHGGGRGGQRLLDYREYVDLRVQVRRHDRQDWEFANPTRMSTGEAIGVGAAVMMVVLTSWERDANLLRSQRATGTLRLLFLDEATRLSHDSLAILFDLCEGLDLQLLIAAPEVAQARGNITYRLVRMVGEGGREEVAVSGRWIDAAGAPT